MQYSRKKPGRQQTTCEVLDRHRSVSVMFCKWRTELQLPFSTQYKSSSDQSWYLRRWLSNGGSKTDFLNFSIFPQLLCVSQEAEMQRRCSLLGTPAPHWSPAASFLCSDTAREKHFLKNSEIHNLKLVLRHAFTIGYNYTGGSTTTKHHNQGWNNNQVWLEQQPHCTAEVDLCFGAVKSISQQWAAHGLCLCLLGKAAMGWRVMGLLMAARAACAMVLCILQSDLQSLKTVAQIHEEMPFPSLLFPL